MEHNHLGNMVREVQTGRLLGGVGHDAHRAWAFPLHTPRGLNVIQEYAFDHGFHNGVFVGQGMVEADGVLSNYWAPHPDWRAPDNHIFQDLGELRYDARPDIRSRPEGFRFTYKTTWTGSDGKPALDEVRHFDLYAAENAIVCDLTSKKTATYGNLIFRANKHGSLGMRLQPQLLPPFGGEILGITGDSIRRGGAEEAANNMACDTVAYEAEPAGLWRFGACMMILENTASGRRDGPWFIRDYGMAMFNATMSEDIALRKGETWTAALRVAAYDGPLDEARAKSWSNLPFDRD